LRDIHQVTPIRLSAELDRQLHYGLHGGIAGFGGTVTRLHSQVYQRNQNPDGADEIAYRTDGIPVYSGHEGLPVLLLIVCVRT
jgi:hypothetical protein